MFLSSKYHISVILDDLTKDKFNWMSTHGTLARGQGSKPLYRQICDALRRDIQLYYKSGDLLPSESELSSNYNVNRHTLRRAVDELVRDGVVTRHRGKGMFVQAPSIEYPIASRTRLTETLKSQGVTSSSRVIRSQMLSAKGRVATALNLEEGTLVMFMEMLREMDRVPFCIGSHFLPASRFPELLTMYKGGSLHGFLEQAYGVQLMRRESMITAVIPEAADLDLLKIPKQQPVLRVKSLNVSKGTKEPLEYVVTRFRGDLTQIVVQPD